MQSVWLCIFQCKPFEETFENTHWRKAKTNASCVTLRHLRLTIWGHFWKYTIVRSEKSATMLVVFTMVGFCWLVNVILIITVFIFIAIYWADWYLHHQHPYFIFMKTKIVLETVIIIPSYSSSLLPWWSPWRTCQGSISYFQGGQEALRTGSHPL